MEEAVRETRLTTFGDTPLEEGLNALCRSLNREAQLNDRGFAAAGAELKDILTQRLKVEDWYRQAPEIQQQAFAAPIMVVGLPRSGTSALSQLLAQDPHNRSIRRWEGAEPLESQTPSGSFFLDAIAEVIPDARLVWAHGDPVRAVPSVASLLATLRRPFTNHLDKVALGRAAKEDFGAAKG